MNKDKTQPHLYFKLTNIPTHCMYIWKNFNSKTTHTDVKNENAEIDKQKGTH